MRRKSVQDIRINGSPIMGSPKTDGQKQYYICRGADGKQYVQFELEQEYPVQELYSPELYNTPPVSPNNSHASPRFHSPRLQSKLIGSSSPQSQLLGSPAMKSNGSPAKKLDTSLYANSPKKDYAISHSPGKDYATSPGRKQDSSYFLNSPTKKQDSSFFFTSTTYKDEPNRNSYGFDTPFGILSTKKILVIIAGLLSVGIILLLILMLIPKNNGANAPAASRPTPVPSVAPKLESTNAEKFFPQAIGDFQASFLPRNCTISVSMRNLLVYVTNRPKEGSCVLEFLSDGSLIIRDRSQVVFMSQNPRQRLQTPNQYAITMTNQGLLLLQDKSTTVPHYFILPVEKV